jgi:hypothetical protein
MLFPQGTAPGEEPPLPDQDHGQARPRVPRGLPQPVPLKPLHEVLGDASVERPVAAAEDVDEGQRAISLPMTENFSPIARVKVGAGGAAAAMSTLPDRARSRALAAAPPRWSRGPRSHSRRLCFSLLPLQRCDVILVELGGLEKLFSLAYGRDTFSVAAGGNPPLPNFAGRSAVANREIPPRGGTPPTPISRVKPPGVAEVSTILASVRFVPNVSPMARCRQSGHASKGMREKALRGHWPTVAHVG